VVSGEWMSSERKRVSRARGREGSGGREERGRGRGRGRAEWFALNPRK